jgi:hypothetical protein
MKKQFHIALILIVLLSFGGLTAGCGNNDQFEAVAKTMAVLTQAAMAGPVVTDTPAPTFTPTETMPPTATPTVTITPTPDFTDFTRVTPAPATINTASWQGVNFKFVKYEVSETTGDGPAFHNRSGRAIRPRKKDRQSVLYDRYQRDV